MESNVGPRRATHLSELFRKQGLYNGRIDIRMGRTQPTLDFAFVEISRAFIGILLPSRTAGILETITPPFRHRSGAGSSTFWSHQLFTFEPASLTTVPCRGTPTERAPLPSSAPTSGMPRIKVRIWRIDGC